jgi:hypothetical protein
VGVGVGARWRHGGVGIEISPPLLFGFGGEKRRRPWELSA